MNQSFVSKFKIQWFEVFWKMQIASAKLTALLSHVTLSNVNMNHKCNLYRLSCKKLCNKTKNTNSAKYFGFYISVVRWHVTLCTAFCQIFCKVQVLQKYCHVANEMMINKKSVTSHLTSRLSRDQMVTWL